MKTFIQITLLTGVALIFTGCETTGLSSRERAGVSYPNYILSLQVNSNSVPAGPLKLPLKLAVAQIGEVAPPQSMIQKLTDNKSLVTSVTALPMPADENNYDKDKKYDYAGNLKNVCRLAKADGADQLFLLGGNIDTWAKNNMWSFLDWTIIGAYTVPGSRVHAEGKAAGVLIDVASGEPLIFVSVDNQTSALSPDMLIDGKSLDMRSRLRDELAVSLSEALLKRLADVH
jgi:hypothetical protein